MSIHVFLGPTLHADVVGQLVPGAVVHPPVAHGDLLRLGLGRGDVVVLVDGYYHQSASVRHKEILSLLASGVRVVGCASMGALRAIELHAHGMVGNGVVFDLFRRGVIDGDDEVAVAHTPGPEYQVLSVPLVAVRFAAGEAERHGALDADETRAIVDVAQDIHYVARSWRAIEVAVPVHLGAAFDRFTAFRAERGSDLDVKTVDTIDTLRRLDELVSSADSGVTVPGRADVDTWFLREWRAEFASSSTDDDVDDGAVLRYQQVYRDDFPSRWRRIALAEVTGGAAAESVERRALAAAAAGGITAASVTTVQERYWLTTAERAEASPEEKVLLMLVRSHHSPSLTHDLLAAQPDLVTEPEARLAVAEAEAVNREVASWAGNYGTDYVKRSVLVAHLAETWEVDRDDPAALDAAARDRGLGSLDRAVDVVRGFYLRARFRAIAARSAV